MPRVKLGRLLVLGSATVLFNLPQWVAPAVSLAQNSGTLRQGFPGRRIGGGTRGECGVSDKKMTALIPDNFLSLTVASSPTLLFYIPLEMRSKSVEFVLRDESDLLIYGTEFTLPDREGIISFSLPSSTTLAVNQNYHWYFSIICDRRDRSGDVVVDGWLRRVELAPVLARRLRGATPLEQAMLYREAGIVNEALIALAELRRTQANDPSVTASWESLLRSIELDAIASAPITESYRGATGSQPDLY
jgi:Domain of Unknown Function (DUF928)